jgi:hypothetical protein
VVAVKTKPKRKTLWQDAAEREREGHIWNVRHNVPLKLLAEDKDERFRPSADLVALVESNWVPSYRCLDRPLVPVLNQLVAKKLKTQFSCADYQVMVRGVSREAARLLEPLRSNLAGATLQWSVMSEALVTQVHWHARDRQANDQALLRAAEAIAKLAPMANEVIHPAGEFVAGAYARIEALSDYRVAPTIVLSQDKKGYRLHIGYSRTKSPATKFSAASLAEVASQFEAIFPAKAAEIESL